MLGGENTAHFLAKAAPVSHSVRPRRPPEQKRHVLYDSGPNVPREQSSEKILGWLDKYWGPVEKR